MATGPEELRAHLADLHRQLQGTRSVGGDVRELLLEVMADIDRVLGSDRVLGGRILGDEAEALAAAESSDTQTAEAGGLESNRLTRRLGDAARQFEDTHPQLAANIGSLASALSRLGI